MRRESDIRAGARTGRGRRARDRLLAGDATPEVAAPLPSPVEDLLLFAVDDLRESALALGGIEAFLIEAEAVLGEPDGLPARLRQLLGGADLGDRVASLDDALGSLVRSLERLRVALPAATYGAETSNTAASTA